MKSLIFSTMLILMGTTISVHAAEIDCVQQLNKVAELKKYDFKYIYQCEIKTYSHAGLDVKNLCFSYSTRKNWSTGDAYTILRFPYADNSPKVEIVNVLADGTTDSYGTKVNFYDINSIKITTTINDNNVALFKYVTHFKGSPTGEAKIERYSSRTQLGVYNPTPSYSASEIYMCRLVQGSN